MSIEQAIYEILRTTPAVQALVGSRIYPDTAPQNDTLPLVVYEQASRQTVMTFSGPVPTDKYGMALHVYGTAKASVRNVSSAIRDRLIGHRGTAPAGGVRILGVFDEDEESDLETPIHGEERGVFAIRINLSLWYKSAA